MLVIAVNQFRREIDGKSQFHRRSPFSRSFSISRSHCPPVFLPFSLTLSCLHFPMFTRHPFDRERGEIPSSKSLYGRSQGGSKFHPESPMYSRLNVFLSNKRYSGQREREGTEEAGGRNIPRYLRITKVTMQNDKSSGASETSQR